jgi:molybdopterin biosynthesis enzyme
MAFPGSVLIFNAGALDENIRKSGEDVRKGECVISDGNSFFSNFR